MTYQETLAWLYGLRRFGIKLGLETIERLLAALGDPHRRLGAVHVAGTNGKGSTCALLAAILRAGGSRVGLYTSPHLLEFTERIRIDGEPIGEEEVVALAAEVQAAAQRALGPRGDGPHPTFFELTTAMAFLHFARAGVDWAVVEVGLGGRFDATNVLLPAAAAVTNIALEHQEYLGRTLAEIAREKAGIIKPGIPVVTASAVPEVLAELGAACAEKGARLIPVREAYRWAVGRRGLEGQTFDLFGPHRAYRGLRLSLAGEHQIENAVTAVALAESLAAAGAPVDGQAIGDGLAGARWPGRLQVMGRDPIVILDGAHNPAGASALATFIGQHRGRRLILVFGVLRDKDWEAMLDLLGPLADLVILTRPESERGARPRELGGADRFCRKLEMEEDVGAALAVAKASADPEDVILVTGSLFTVAAALRALGVARV